MLKNKMHKTVCSESRKPRAVYKWNAEEVKAEKEKRGETRVIRADINASFAEMTKAIVMKFGIANL